MKETGFDPQKDQKPSDRENASEASEQPEQPKADSTEEPDAESDERKDAESEDTVEEEPVSENGSVEEAVPEDPIKMQLLRLQADFQNFRKRAEREKEGTIRYANERLLIQLLDVADNFERALGSEKEHDNFYHGMEMIHTQLVEVLTKNGLEEIESDGEPFDPALHNAVLVEASDMVKPDHIIQTLQKGYRLNGKVVRPAMVKVAK